MSPVEFDVVIPTIRRPTLTALVAALRREDPPGLREVFVVEDRNRRGPAATRNAGWRAGSAPWVVFLDDDVELPKGWGSAVASDLAACAPNIAGTQARVTVPLPTHRNPTDWERNVAGLADARWATADMAYRRDALRQVGGFDERFPRAYREDADLALRVLDAGWQLRRGARHIVHPVRPAPWSISMCLQRGNADDAFMRMRHGRDWRARAGAPAGCRARHLVTTGAALVALASAAARRGRAARAAATAWVVMTGAFALRRVRPGPRTPAEITAMLITSVAIPPAATFAWLRGITRARRLQQLRSRLDAVLFDRDGTLVVDVPYNGDPERVSPMPGARAALDRVRQVGLQLGVVTNQSGVARGVLDSAAVDRVNARVDALLGPFATVRVCPHGPDDGCSCRKPAGGLIRDAARDLGVEPHRCVVIGDIGSDVEAARAAGASAILIPTAITRHEEITAAPRVANDLAHAVDALVGGAS